MLSSLGEALLSLGYENDQARVLDRLLATGPSISYLIDCDSKEIVFFSKREDSFLPPSFLDLLKERKSWIELISENQREGYLTFLDTLSSGSNKDRIEYSLETNRRGELVAVQDYIVPMENKGGEIVGYLGRLHDDSFRIQAMDTLAKRSWSEVSTIVTRRFLHDFNNTIAGVYSLSELYSEPGSEAETMVEAMQHIRESSVRAQKIVQKIRSLNSPLESEQSFFDVEKLIVEQKEYLEALLPKGAELELDLSGESMPAYLDSNRFRQTLLHLASNARDAMGEQSPKLVIRSRSYQEEEDSEKKCVIIEFIDNGTGIREKDMPNIFKPFTSSKDARRHSGMGLFIVKRFVEEMGGGIDLETWQDKGTAVSIRFPIANLNETFSSPKPETSQGLPSQTAKAEKNPTVLIYTWEDITRHPIISSIRNGGWKFRIHLDAHQLILDIKEMRDRLDGILLFKSSLDEKAEPLIEELSKRENCPKLAIIALGESIDAIPESIRAKCGLVASGSTKPSGLLKKLTKFYR